MSYSSTGPPRRTAGLDRQRQTSLSRGRKPLAGLPLGGVQQWRAISVAVGGVVAVGFLGEELVIIGSHSGTGVFDARTGKRTERTCDSDYSWYQSDPPLIRYPSAEGMRLVRAAGLWGGDLAQSSADGWTCRRTGDGTVLRADGQPDFRIWDPEEYRTQGFSPEGSVFVYATSPTVHLATRTRAEGMLRAPP